MKKRYASGLGFVAIAFFGIVAVCFYNQFFLKEEFYKKADLMTSSADILPALRGNILDRNGKILVSNRLCLSVQVQGSIKSEDYNALCDILNIDKKDYVADESFIAARDISSKQASALKELNIEGVSVIKDYTRDYSPSPSLSHTLGYTGLISQEELEKNKSNGYSFDDVLGKCGVEQICEMYLRGADGKRIRKKGEIVSEKLPVGGCDVKLTIDKFLQQAVESELEGVVKEVEENTGYTSGGAVVVLKTDTGEILAMASYPDYELSSVRYEYNELLKNQSNPLLNRCISGVYEPGSTFKPLVALAALDSGVIKEGEIIEDKGVYTFYAPTYTPSCHIWTTHRKTHGEVDVTGALENSCNYFFYETGRRLTIENIQKYAEMFCLGQICGVELSGEASGCLASPISKPEWYAGDTLQASIGQSVNMFTPLQLAVYTAALANNGTVYRPFIIDEIKNDEEKTVNKTESVVLKKADVKEKNFDIVREGMRKCVVSGTAKASFSGADFTAGGKTGTAQVPNGPENGIFIGFAPFENPEISISVVIEHGYGDYASYLSARILDKYFNLY